MRLVSDLSPADLRGRLRAGSLRLRLGPYIYRLQSRLPGIAEGIQTLYADFPLGEADQFVDYGVSLGYAGILARLRRQLAFAFDDRQAFGSIPAAQAYAFLEWGMNWCVSMHPNEYLKLHAGVIARHGAAVVMPGVPGSGKSTLCAALTLSGWRLLSDEHALVLPGSSQVAPLCRPISLKNESIPLIKGYDSQAVFGPVCRDTHKGDVAHMKGDLHADSHDPAPLPVVALVFPRYSASDAQQLSRRSKCQSFILAARHAFNYNVLGRQGFHTMETLIDAVECYDLTYRDLAWAVRTMEALSGRRVPL